MDGGWGVMLFPVIIYANSLREAFYNTIEKMSMYGTNHSGISFTTFLIRTKLDRTAVHCLFKVNKKYDHLSDEELVAFYSKHRLKRGFKEVFEKEPI